MSWFSRHAESIEAGAAMVTALVATAALIGVKLQLDAADRVQQSQSARDAYRSHLALAVTHPQYAEPPAMCDQLEAPDRAAYVAFVGHLMYSAEQMLRVESGWDTTFLEHLAPHTGYICSDDGPVGDTEETVRLLAQSRGLFCAEATPC